jgi:hypothetical protein
MSNVDKFLEGVLEGLLCRVGGLSPKRARTEARALLDENLLTLDDVLEAFLGEPRVCPHCGVAWLDCGTREAGDSRGSIHVCEHCA